MTELWRSVVGYEGLYEVSNLGRVRSRYAVNGHVLSTAATDKDGYPVVALSAPDGRHTFALHRLVAKAFHGGRQSALHNEVAHLDGSRANARADNLKWVSKVENHSHKRAHGTHQRGSKHPRALLTEADIPTIRDRSLGRQYLSARFGISVSTIDDIRLGKNWKHVPRSDATGTGAAEGESPVPKADAHTSPPSPPKGEINTSIIESENTLDMRGDGQ